MIDQRDAMTSIRRCRGGTDKETVVIMSNQSEAPLNSKLKSPPAERVFVSL